MTRSRLVKVQTELPCRYSFREPVSPQGLILLLHGYKLSGEYLFRRLQSQLCPERGDLTEWAVISPDGPFPVPGKRMSGDPYVGYSWYFYDAAKDEYVLDMEPAQSYVVSLIAKLGFESLPKIIIGYSQGGYLAPFVAQRLTQVRQVIGVSCEFLHEELTGELPFRMDAVHGALDDIVDPEKSRRSHLGLVARGVQGSFASVGSAGHRLTPEIAAQVGQLLHFAVAP